MPEAAAAIAIRVKRKGEVLVKSKNLALADVSKTSTCRIR